MKLDNMTNEDFAKLLYDVGDELLRRGNVSLAFGDFQPTGQVDGPRLSILVGRGDAANYVADAYGTIVHFAQATGGDTSIAHSTQNFDTDKDGRRLN